MIEDFHLEKLFSEIPEKLVSTLLKEYNKIKTNFIEGKWETSELGGGKFSEAIFRILEWYTENHYTPLGKTIRNFLQATKKFENKSDFPDSIRLHIPRILNSIYDIRNHRGVGHLSGDVDPNHMDATFIIMAADWIMAELVRIFHNVSITEAQNIVESLIVKKIPLIWNLSNKKRVLNPKLSYKDQMLVLLYDAYPEYVTENILISWIEHSNPSIFRRDVIIPAHKIRLIEYDKKNRKLKISPVGRNYIEKNISLTL